MAGQLKYQCVVLYMILLMVACSPFPGGLARAAESAGQSSSAGEIFGIGGGYLHPSLGLSTLYTDNYYNAPAAEESDWITTISPALWLALPATRSRFVPLDSSIEAPGGQGVTRLDQADRLGFQSSLGYRADIERNQDHSEDNIVRQQGQGLLQYHFAGGLSVELSDVYTLGYEDYASGVSQQREEYQSNLANLLGYYQVSPLLQVRAGYSNFKLDYDSAIKRFQERTDQKFSSYVLYQLLPKTKLFLQYDQIRTEYDRNILSDSRQHHYFAGLKFDSRARVTGLLKLGYGQTDSERSGAGDEDDFIGEAELAYRFWGRSMLRLKYLRTVYVTTDLDYQNILHSQLRLSLTHNFSRKIASTLYAGIGRDEFRGGSAADARDDDLTRAGLSVRYSMQDWLTWQIAYNVLDRDSNLDENDYQRNNVIVSVEAAF